MSKNIQTPASNDNIVQNHPNIPRTEATLTGNIGNSMNAGHNRTIAYKRVMAGEMHKQFSMKLKIRTLTPLTVSYQKLMCTINTYFVPDSRVWTNAEKFIAQAGGTSEIKIPNMPYIGQEIPIIETETHAGFSWKTSIMNTTIWRDCFASCYMPRIGMNVQKSSEDNEMPVEDLIKFRPPKFNVLPLRGRIAIYNDYERSKSYDEEIVEYKGNSVAQDELNHYMPVLPNMHNFYTMRAKKPNSYYTDYRTEYQGFESSIPTGLQSDKSLVMWADWESKIAEARQQASNENKLPSEILQELRGSKLLTEGKTQHIGQYTFALNYNSITQNTYNTNENIVPEFQVLGQQGGYSYTEIEVPCYAGFVANEEGTIHVIMTVWCPTTFESGYDRTMLNINALDQYRPELVDEKFDVIYQCENDTTYPPLYMQALGYKRKFNELFKLPNCIGGDLTTKWYKQTEFDRNIGYKLEIDDTSNNTVNVITNNTYQFYETSRSAEVQNVGFVDNNRIKKIWKDYSDLMLAKNQAIMPKIEGKDGEIMIYGQNQIDVIGEAKLSCILPVDEKIANNYTLYGEH